MNSIDENEMDSLAIKLWNAFDEDESDADNFRALAEVAKDWATEKHDLFKTELKKDFGTMLVPRYPEQYFEGPEGDFEGLANSIRAAMREGYREGFEAGIKASQDWVHKKE